MSKFIDIHHIKQEHDILPEEGHNSSLHICLDGLKILGVLPHGGKIEPKTIHDADTLIEWLKQWISKKDGKDKATQ